LLPASDKAPMVLAGLEARPFGHVIVIIVEEAPSPAYP
jgi:hypothetical protein